MKKLLFTTAIISLLFAGCNKDNNGDDPNDPSTERVKKLPSRIIVTNFLHIDTINFQYDDQNRLTKITDRWSENTITYNVSGNPINVIWRWLPTGIHYTTPLQHRGNQIFTYAYSPVGRYDDTLTIDANGRLEKSSTRTYIYSSNGNLTNIISFGNDTVKFEYANSNARSIWRHINTPDWFLTYFLSDYGRITDIILSFVPAIKIGFMPTQKKPLYNLLHDNLVKYEYGFDSDGYVRQIDQIESWIDWSGTEHTSITVVYTIEYIPAR
jgi:YD repeat-containing protein